jgi:hypothetical protein
MHKTHVSKDTYEFAKRWICKEKEITGIPMNGIIENINNPFIVMVNLFDYFIVIENYYSSSKNLLTVVSSLYKGLTCKLSKRFDNYRFKMKVKVFHETLNFSFGYSTQDSLREILCLNITNENYVIPGNNLIHHVYDDVIQSGLGKTIEKGISNIGDICQKLIDSKDLLNLDDVNDVRKYPIFKGIVNHLNRYQETVKT